jgi:hypothetical protein
MRGAISGPQRQLAASSAALGGTPHTLRPLPDPLKGANIHKAVLDKDLFERLGQCERISKFSLLACRLAERGRSWSSVVISGHQWSSVVLSKSSPGRGVG